MIATIEQKCLKFVPKSELFRNKSKQKKLCIGMKLNMISRPSTTNWKKMNYPRNADGRILKEYVNKKIVFLTNSKKQGKCMNLWGTLIIVWWKRLQIAISHLLNLTKQLIHTQNVNKSDIYNVECAITS
jgi:hypothetical protein